MTTDTLVNFENDCNFLNKSEPSCLLEMVLSIITWCQPSVRDREVVDAVSRSGSHKTMEISLFKGQVLTETWLAMLVPHC